MKELRAHLRCGVLAHGAVLLQCDHCGKSRWTALSCGSRSIWPRSTGRMTELAHEWTRGVLPLRACASGCSRYLLLYASRSRGTTTSRSRPVLEGGRSGYRFSPDVPLVLDDAPS